MTAAPASQQGALFVSLRLIAYSCKGRAFCPSCGGRRMNAGALTLVDYVLPEVPIRQLVLTMPFSLRLPLAFDGKLLGQGLRIFTDTVASKIRRSFHHHIIGIFPC